MEGVQIPYWNKNITYNQINLFGYIIQVADYHSASIPEDVLPPEYDVNRFIEKISNYDDIVTVPKQFEILMDITNNDLLGALHLGFVSTRIMARGLDTRAYPNITVTESDMVIWSKKIAQFEVFNNHCSDSPGDTYYFWTHMFAAVFYGLNRSNRRLYKTAFAHGTEIMKFFRKVIADTPITADHIEASYIGRRIGLLIVDLYSKNNNRRR